MSFLNKIESDVNKVVDTKAALECIEYILEHEDEDFFDFAHNEGVHSANDNWKALEHVYAQALIAIGKEPTFPDDEVSAANYQLSLIKSPIGKYVFVGDVPNTLAFDKEVAPELAKEISQSSNPTLVMKKYGLKSPVFTDVKEALQFAKKRGVKESDIDVQG